MFCPHCGAPNPAHLAHCNRCGGALTTDPAVPPPQPTRVRRRPVPSGVNAPPERPRAAARAPNAPSRTHPPTSSTPMAPPKLPPLPERAPSNAPPTLPAGRRLPTRPTGAATGAATGANRAPSSGERGRSSPWDTSSVGGAPAYPGAPRGTRPPKAAPALRRRDSDVTDDAAKPLVGGSGLPVGNGINELTAWLDSRGAEAEETVSTPVRPSVRPPPEGRIARAGAIPAIDAPPLTPQAKAHAAAADDGAAETVRLGREDPARPRMSVSDLVLPPNDEPSADRASSGARSDPRLSNPHVRGLGLGPTPAELTRLGDLAEGGSSDTVSAPGELAGILRDVDESALERALGASALADRAVRLRGSPEKTEPEMTGPILSAARRGQPARPQEAARRGRQPQRPVPGRKPTPARAAGRPPPRPTRDEIRFSAAPLWRRLLATIIDGSMVLTLILLPLRVGWFGEVAQRIRPWEPDDIGRALFAGHLTVPLGLTVVAVLVLGAIPHGLAGRTPGKLLTGLMLVNSWTGRRPGWTQVILRQLIGLLTTGLGIASYFWLIVDRRSSALHDRLAGTSCVIAGSRNVRAARDPIS